MGTSTSRIWDPTVNKSETRLWLLGLGAGGKTTFLCRLKTGETVQTVPTIGFNVESVTYKNQDFTIYDYGGTNKMRDCWRIYFEHVGAVLFFVDSTDAARFGDAAIELAFFLRLEELRHTMLLVVANKQDKNGARGIQEISEALNLGSIQDRNWSIVKCCALDDGAIGKVMDSLLVGHSTAQ